MNDINFKESRIAVSNARKNPTAQSKAVAIQLLKELSDAISGLTEVERPPDGWKLAKKTRKTRNRNAKLELQQAKTCVCVTYIKGKAEKSYQAPRNTSDAVLPKGVSVERAMRLLRMQLQESSNL